MGALVQCGALSFDTLFGEAAALPDATARAEFLRRACGADDDLRRKLEELLAAHFEAGDFLTESPRGANAARTAVQELASPCGSNAATPDTLIGPYKLLEQIGEGGFGVVYMAEQQWPVHRRVALKLLKPGLDTRQVVARFEAERQALALMDHPNIARVFDGGESPPEATGGISRPYFVMELVRGIPITEFADENRLPLRERLELFLSVCGAVQHAHQKGIIHRDLKPTNVLVTLHDTTPVPKVIDFGLAKSSGARLTEKTLFTNFAQFVGTPLYMSPEQAQMSGLDVDTRSDVYSLGVLLYELLTGTTPFDKVRLRDVGYDELRRIIREEEPARPSARLSTLGAAAVTVSANRRHDARQLLQQLRGELDWVVMKALEKDRNRRYESASALAADVQRYLRDEPVEACPPSAWYRLSKAARRHRTAMGAGALVAAALLLGTAVATWQAIAATRAKDQAQAREAETRTVLEFVEKRILAANRPEGQEGGLGRDVTLRQAIEAAVPSIERDFGDQPLIQARLRFQNGVSFRLLGDYQRAVDQWQKAVPLYSLHLGDDHLDTLRAKCMLAIGLSNTGRHRDGIKLLEDLPEHQKSMLDLAEYTVPTTIRAEIYLQLGRATEAHRLAERAFEHRGAKLGPDHETTIYAMRILSIACSDLNQNIRAIALHEEVLTRCHGNSKVNAFNVALAQRDLAACYSAGGRNDEAIRYGEEALRKLEQNVGRRHSSACRCLHVLAHAYRIKGCHEKAIELFKESVAGHREKFGPDYDWCLRSLAGWGLTLLHMNRGSEAVPLFDECVRRAKGQDLDPRIVMHPIEFRRLHFERQRDVAGLQETATMWEDLNRPDEQSQYVAARNHIVTAGVLHALGDSVAAEAENERARRFLNEALTAGARAEPWFPDHDPDMKVKLTRPDIKAMLEKMEAAKAARTGSR